MPSPYDPYVPIDPPVPLLRRETIRRAGGGIPADGGDGLHRVIDFASGAVVKEGSRDACLDHVVSRWEESLWVPDPYARARARNAVIRLRFERWDDFTQRWVPDTTLTGAVVGIHAPI